MQLIPKKYPKKVTFTLSGQTAAILEQYAKYTEETEEHIVNQFLKNILVDQNFAKYLRGQRRNKRIINRIFLGDPNMTLLDLYAKDAPIFNYDDEDTENENTETEEAKGK